MNGCTLHILNTLRGGGYGTCGSEELSILNWVDSTLKGRVTRWTEALLTCIDRPTPK
jgi:hypothetical protein